MANFSGIASSAATAAAVTTSLDETPVRALSDHHDQPLGAWLSTHVGPHDTLCIKPCPAVRGISSDAAKLAGNGFGGDDTPWSIKGPARDRPG